MKYQYIAKKMDSNRIKYQFIVEDECSCRGFEDINYREFIRLLKEENREFLQVFTEALKNATKELKSAYFWECVPVSQATLDKNFEFVVTKSSGLDNIKQNFSRYQEYIDRDQGKLVSSFSSFSSFSNTNLVIPIPQKSTVNNDYWDFKNISEFTKNASPEQQKKLWQIVANILAEELKKNFSVPRWLSTHGLEVHYLHVRICQTPMYYQWQEYREEKNKKTPAEIIERLEWEIRFLRNELLPRLNDLNQKQKIQNKINYLEKQAAILKNPNNGLVQVQSEAINTIRAKLAESPEISSEELDNPNWENEIILEQDTGKIATLQSQILADIKNKRQVKNKNNGNQNPSSPSESGGNKIFWLIGSCALIFFVLLLIFFMKKRKFRKN